MAAVLMAAPAMAQHENHGDHDHGMDTMEHAPQLVVPKSLSAQATCPISGEDLEDQDTFIDFEGQRIYVCCKKCKKKVVKRPEQIAMELYAQGVLLENVQTIDPVTGEELKSKEHFHQLYNKRIYVNDKKDVAKVAADPAKYLDVLEGRHAQEKCAVRGGDIDPEAGFVIKGMQVGQCCPGCEKKWKADPAAYFAKLAADHVVLEPATMSCPFMPKMQGSKKYPITLGSRRYYLCSEMAALKFANDPEKYLPAWYAMQ